MVVLTAASFVPYVGQVPGVPSYFVGACFFLSMLTGRMLERGFAASMPLARLGAAAALATNLGSGNFCSHPRRTNKSDRDTLSVPGPENVLHDTNCLSGHRRVHRDLKQGNVTSVCTTISFVYPLLFESGETLAVSNEIFGTPYRVYPEDMLWCEPKRDQEAAFVVETDAPIRSLVEVRCGQVFGSPPLAREYCKLTVIRNR